MPQVCSSVRSSSAFLVQLTKFHVEDVCPEPLYFSKGSIDPIPVLSSLDLNPLLYCTKAEAHSFYECAQSISSNSDFLSSELLPVTFTLDSGSDVHVIQLDEAVKYFTSKSASNLKVLGVSGNTSSADLQGHLVIVVQDERGEMYKIDLGLAHGMSSVPVNLLSVSLLMKSGCIVHLEEGHCYLQLHKDGSQIAIRCNNGMFEIDALPDMFDSNTEPCSSMQSYSVEGTSFTAFGNLTTWHRRLGHLSRNRLLNIHKSNAVDGFKLKGHNPVDVPCDTCAQSKIQRSAVPHERKFRDPATYIGHTVSSDVKSLSATTFCGSKYVVNFVDHYSLLGLVYFVRSKADIYGVLEKYLADMKSFGVIVKTLQTDRGSEYFSQEGDLIEDRDRNLHNFGKVCLAQDPIVRHVVQPVEMKEKVAENSFRYLFRAVNSMLWEARLCPAFWDDACAYAQYLWNRTPNVRTTDSTTPWTLLTGKRPRWDKFKVFGCDAWQHIPNNSLYKVPGIPRGRRCIFLGFDLGFGGFKIFHPDTRTYEHSSNCYFNEDFSYRQDAISYHDTQRAQLKNGVDLAALQIQTNDFDDPNAAAVRNLFIDPDTPAPTDYDYDPSVIEEHQVCASPSISNNKRVDTFSHTTTNGDLHSSCDSSDSNTLRGGAAASDVLGSDADAGGVDQANQAIPAHGVTVAGQIRGLVHDGVILRPLRLLPVGTKVTVRNDDKKFLQYALHNDLPIKYLEPCPKKRLTPSRDRYLMYMLANTLRVAFRSWCRYGRHQVGLLSWLYSISDA